MPASQNGGDCPQCQEQWKLTARRVFLYVGAAVVIYVGWKYVKKVTR